MADRSPKLIALDWGTSSLRAYLLGEDAQILAERSHPWGIMHSPPGGFAAAFHQAIGDWRASWPAIPAVAAGMIGSRQGWLEAPYCPCPAGAAELAAAMTRLPTADGVLHIIPGIEQRGAAPNVMRGEETQAVGALELEPSLRQRSLLILPGTHCKWARVNDGRIIRYDTFMTGELFAVLRDHSILGRPAAEAAAPPSGGWAAFDRGVQVARQAGRRGLAPNLFLTRSLVLNGEVAAAYSLDFLSGLLIGEELRVELHEAQEPVLALIGEAVLCERYRRAFAQFGVPAVRCLQDVSPAGVWRIAALAGLLEAAPPAAAEAAGQGAAASRPPEG
jgi:2-dehydro-3-deoxygalactonokinase